MSVLRRTCDLEWRPRPSDWQWSYRPWVGLSSQQTWWMVIASAVSEIIKHFLFSWLRFIIINTWCISMTGSYRAKFDDDDFNIFRGIACEGNTDRQTDKQTDRQTRVWSKLKCAATSLTTLQTKTGDCMRGRDLVYAPFAATLSWNHNLNTDCLVGLGQKGLLKAFSSGATAYHSKRPTTYLTFHALPL